MAKTKQKKRKNTNKKQQNQANNAPKTTTELLENPDALREKIFSSEELIKKYKFPLIVVGAVIVLIVAGLFGYQYYQEQQEKDAQENMFPAVYFLEADSLDKALMGDGNYYGFQNITDEYSSTNAANLAHFYAGVAYLKKGEFETAIDELEAFSSSDELLQARAYSLIGDACLELEQFDNAVDYYQQAVDYKPNKFLTPQYMMKLALAYELKPDNGAAIKVYQELIDNYPIASETPNAKKYKARLEQLQEGN